MKHREVRAYYDVKNEWDRLDTPGGRLEFQRTLKLVEKHFPPGGRILDLGGGPGRYALALARLGYRVCLADLSARQLAEARERIAGAAMQDRIESIDEVDALDLGRYGDASFDGVLALGPFYHLTDRDDRLAAAREMRRVMKPRGRALIAFLPRLWSTAALIYRAAQDPDQVSVAAFREAFRGGAFLNPRENAFGGFFEEPFALRQLLEEARLLWVETVSVRGIADRYEESLWALERVHPELFHEVLRFIDATAAEPAVIASCGHAIIAMQKSIL